jgi:hypothetical protein
VAELQKEKYPINIHVRLKRFTVPAGWFTGSERALVAATQARD